MTSHPVCTPEEAYYTKEITDFLEEEEKASSSTQSADIPRVELMWRKEIQDLFDVWLQTCEVRIEAHAKACKINKFRHRFFGVLTILIPTILSGVTQVYSPPLLVTFGFIINGILSGIQTLFNFGGLYTAHNEYSAKYEDFKRAMEAELVKPRKFRIAADVYLKACEMKLNALTRSAPDL